MCVKESSSGQAKAATYVMTDAMVGKDEYASNPCLNGGNCTSRANTYRCFCPPGYFGVNCENDIDNCASSPCQNEGICTDQVNAYTCSCAAGYTGLQCETGYVQTLGKQQGEPAYADGMDTWAQLCPLLHHVTLLSLHKLDIQQLEDGHCADMVEAYAGSQAMKDSVWAVCGNDPPLPEVLDTQRIFVHFTSKMDLMFGNEALGFKLMFSYHPVRTKNGQMSDTFLYLFVKTAASVGSWCDESNKSLWRKVFLYPYVQHVNLSGDCALPMNIFIM